MTLTIDAERLRRPNKVIIGSTRKYLKNPQNCVGQPINEVARDVQKGCIQYFAHIFVYKKIFFEMGSR